MKGVVIYKGRYGATAQYASWIGNILQVPVYENDELNNARLNEFDYVIAGTSVYVGKLLLANWINSHEKILSSKKLFLFVVCATPSAEVDELNNLIEKNISPGLQKTMKVFFLRGRMIKSKLSVIDRVVLHMGAWLQKDQSEKEKMLTDFDDVRQENLVPVLNAIRTDSPVPVR
jgi:menaquinone-dependent protoporphyrinogen IX oxidase